nr:hypothetical protein CFP56_38173 [Quercus suber]
MPHPTTLVAISTTTPAKSFAKSKKKKFAFDGLNRSAIIALLKQQWKDEEEGANTNSEEEEDDQESGASSEASIANNDNPYYPYNQELFGYDEACTPDLGKN